MNYEEMVMNRRRPLGTNLARAGAILAGQKPSDDDDFIDKIYAREAIQNQFKNPLDERLKTAQIAALEAKNDPNTPKPLTAGQELARDKATTDIYENYEINKAKKGVLDRATEGSENIPQGWWGKTRLGITKAFPSFKGFLGISDDAIRDSQEMKMALTQGTLAETAYTKGAISDEEMALFKNASANDDFNSPAVIPVLRKIRDFIEAEESGKMGAYKQNYGEDPRSWFNDSVSQMKGVQTPTPPKLTDEQAYEVYLKRKKK